MTDRTSAWPELPVAEWVDTRDTLHLRTQVVGKVRMANTPLMNHWWNVPLYVTARGLTTGLIPYGGPAFSIDFDFIDHQLVVSTTGVIGGPWRWSAGPIADFYREVMGSARRSGTVHRDLADAGRDRRRDPVRPRQQHIAYDRDEAQRFWLALVQMNRVFEVFRAALHRQGQPGALLLGCVRPGGHPVLRPARAHASRRRAELRPARDVGGLLARGEQRRILARPGRRGRLLLLRLPRPPGYRRRSVSPAPATFDEALGEFTLPYTAVRDAEDPDAVLLDFLQSTYEAAADTAGWDREALERGQ